MNTNRILLRGTLTGAPVFSHESHQKRFYRQSMQIPRLSGAADTLNLLLPEELLPLSSDGQAAEISGTVRSFNNRTGAGSKLVITVLVHTLIPSDAPADNILTLTGTLCKPPIFRRTPLGREICDLMLAVPRHYGRSDYLPCIAWGATARRCAALAVGDTVTLEGRLQSREYIKQQPEGPITKTAFEISISSLCQA